MFEIIKCIILIYLFLLPYFIIYLIDWYIFDDT